MRVHRKNSNPMTVSLSLSLPRLAYSTSFFRTFARLCSHRNKFLAMANSFKSLAHPLSIPFDTLSAYIGRLFTQGTFCYHPHNPCSRAHELPVHLHIRDHCSSNVLHLRIRSGFILAKIALHEWASFPASILFIPNAKHD